MEFALGPALLPLGLLVIFLARCAMWSAVGSSDETSSGVMLPSWLMLVAASATLSSRSSLGAVFAGGCWASLLHLLTVTPESNVTSSM